jgi:hypothetical protein
VLGAQFLDGEGSRRVLRELAGVGKTRFRLRLLMN